MRRERKGEKEKKKGVWSPSDYLSYSSVNAAGRKGGGKKEVEQLSMKRKKRDGGAGTHGGPAIEVKERKGKTEKNKTNGGPAACRGARGERGRGGAVSAPKRDADLEAG